MNRREGIALTDKPKIIAVVGPTASGKTALAVGLAERLGGEVVSCDSMQIYRGMDIGTAKPTAEEMRGVPHHLIDIVDPDVSFTAADYTLRATAAAEDIISRGKLPVFCGGTGLYLDSFLRGGFEDMAEDVTYRERLKALAEREGVDTVHAVLAGVDPESAAKIHPNNVRRVIRALEIFHVTGMTKTELDRRSRMGGCRFSPVLIGLRFRDREQLYRRIDSRVDRMLADGLTDEVKRLFEAGVFERSRTAAQAIGYKELLGVVRGTDTAEAAEEELKRATRRYAKRQLTWFGANPDIHWIEPDDRSFDDILDEAVGICRNA